MADKGLYYGSLGRQALASSYSALDGVPFKIATSFRQDPKTISLPVLETSGGSGAFNEEYAFETEEAVLAWARARDEAIKKAKQEEAEKAAQAAAAQKKVASKHDEDSIGLESNCNSPSTHGISHTKANGSDMKAQGTSQGNAGYKPLRPNVPPRPPPPKPAAKPGSILKPTPIQQLNKAGEGNDAVSSKPAVSNSTSKDMFDITMFEQEADPFDNLELQTIDDMEELKVLLDSSSSVVAVTRKEEKRNDEHNGMNIPITGSENDSNASEGVYELAGPISTNNWVTFENPGFSQSCESPALSTDSNKGGNMASSTDSSVSDAGEYVKITTGQIQPPSSLNTHVNGMTAHPSSDTSTNVSTQQGNPLGSNLPPHFQGTGIFKPVLPPIPKPRQTVANGPLQTNEVSQNESEQGEKSMLPASSQPFTTINAFNTDQSNSITANPSNGLKPGRVALPPPLSKPSAVVPQTDDSVKMWSSVGPSLASSLDSNKENNKTNQYSRHSMEWHGASPSPDVSLGQGSSPIPVDKPSQSPSSQLWNRYRPLPPAPSPSGSDNPALAQRPSSQAVGLSDPYFSLPKEAQTFVDRITSMGFLKAKVARAVQKFGQDEKEVLDHLIAVDTLEQKKFAPLYAEMALHSCQNDCEKAERFLNMQAQFEELGFSREKIQDALVKSDMNHDKALDLLTACSP